MDALAAAEAYGLIKDALSDYFDISISDGKGKNQGKVVLKKKQMHGMGSAPETLIAMEMGRRRAETGESLVDDSRRADIEPLRKAFDDLLSGQAYRELGGAGLRESTGGDEMKARAWSMMQSYDKGYNPETGAPYGAAGTDGGHKKPHSLYPELSKAPDNIMPENAYENRTKGAAETPEEEAERLATGLIKKIIADHEMVPYSAAAQAEIAAGPEIMQVNRKGYLKALRQGRQLY